MSYYHYFKLKEDSKYNNYEPPKFPKWGRTPKDKILLKGAMINAFYEEKIEKKFDNISLYVMMLKYSLEDSYLKSLLKEITEDKNKEISRNRPDNEYEMQSNIDDYEDNLNHVIESLFILSCIKFIPDTEYSDTPKTEMDYLKYEYLKEVESEIQLLEDYVYDYVFSKFVLENCTRQTEDERYSSEDE